MGRRRRQRFNLSIPRIGGKPWAPWSATAIRKCRWPRSRDSPPPMPVFAWRLARIKCRHGSADARSAQALVAAWPKFDDDFQRSAAVGAAARNPAATPSRGTSTARMLPSRNCSRCHLAQRIGEKTMPPLRRNSSSPSPPNLPSADALKRTILDTLAKVGEGCAAMTPEAFRRARQTARQRRQRQRLPLAAKWDKAGALKPRSPRSRRR